MSLDKRTVAETVLTVANKQGEEFTIVAFDGGGYGITRAGQPVEGYYANMQLCIDALVKLSGITFDVR